MGHGTTKWKNSIPHQKAEVEAEVAQVEGEDEEVVNIRCHLERHQVSFALTPKKSAVLPFVCLMVLKIRISLSNLSKILFRICEVCDITALQIYSHSSP